MSPPHSGHVLTSTPKVLASNFAQRRYLTVSRFIIEVAHFSQVHNDEPRLSAPICRRHFHTLKTEDVEVDMKIESTTSSLDEGDSSGQRVFQACPFRFVVEVFDQRIFDHTVHCSPLPSACLCEMNVSRFSATVL